jgi:hypothetical protein
MVEGKDVAGGAAHADSPGRSIKASSASSAIRSTSNGQIWVTGHVPDEVAIADVSQADYSRASGRAADRVPVPTGACLRAPTPDTGDLQI